MLTGGERSDGKEFATLPDVGSDRQPRAVVADEGYDAKADRVLARSRGIAPVVPIKSDAKTKPTFFARRLYRARARIEQTFGELERFKRAAFRCEQTSRIFASFVALARGFIIKSVHTA